MMNRREQGMKNLELARHFLRGIVRNPSTLKAIPDGATVVLMPTDDEELVAANAAMARNVDGQVAVVRVESDPAPEGRPAPAPPTPHAVGLT